MAIINPSNVNEIEFDEQDIDVFKIPDVKERIDALQKHFFPRLELLVKDSLELIREIYGVEPYDVMTDVMTDVKRPSNRPNAATNTEYEIVCVGLSGKFKNLNKDKPFAIKNASGKPTYTHSAYLSFNILSEGCIKVVFKPFTTSTKPSFISKIRQEIFSNYYFFKYHFKQLKIFYNSNTIENYDDFYKLINAKHFGLSEKKDIRSLYFCTGSYFLPTNFKEELWNLKQVFVCLYPLLDSFISIGDGREPRLDEMINKFDGWIYKRFQMQSAFYIAFLRKAIVSLKEKGDDKYICLNEMAKAIPNFRYLHPYAKRRAIADFKRERNFKYIEWLDTASTDKLFVEWLNIRTFEEKTLMSQLENSFVRWLDRGMTSQEKIIMAQAESS